MLKYFYAILIVLIFIAALLQILRPKFLDNSTLTKTSILFYLVAGVSLIAIGIYLVCTDSSINYIANIILGAAMLAQAFYIKKNNTH